MHGRILHAEDSEDDALLLSIAFKEAGLCDRILHVWNGEEAVSYLCGREPYSDRSIHPLPDLLILDLKMPLTNGSEVLTWLRSRDARELKGLRVVILSSSADPSDIARARSLAADDFLVKPPRLEDLVELARRLHTAWLTEDREAA